MFMTKRKKIIIGIVIIAISAGAFWYFTKNSSPKMDKTKLSMIMKAISHPKFVAVSSGLIDVQGGISNINAPKSGVIKQVFVIEGDIVKKDQILAVQENGQEKIAVQQAKANLESQYAQNELVTIQRKTAKRELSRLTPLHKIGAVTQREFDSATDRVLQQQVNIKINKAHLLGLETRLTQAKFNLTQRTILAPLDGQIVEVKARPGVGASAQNVTSLFKIIPHSKRIIRGVIDDSVLNDIFIEQDALVYSDIDKSKQYLAKVIRISLYIPKEEGFARYFRSGRAQTIGVVLSMDTSPLLIGQKVQIRFLRRGVDAKKALEEAKAQAKRRKRSPLSKTSSQNKPKRRIIIRH